MSLRRFFWHLPIATRSSTPPGLLPVLETRSSPALIVVCLVFVLLPLLRPCLRTARYTSSPHATPSYPSLAATLARSGRQSFARFRSLLAFASYACLKEPGSLIHKSQISNLASFSELIRPTTSTYSSPAMSRRSQDVALLTPEEQDFKDIEAGKSESDTQNQNLDHEYSIPSTVKFTWLGTYFFLSLVLTLYNKLVLGMVRS